jgi:hypothetical protein
MDSLGWTIDRHTAKVYVGFTADQHGRHLRAACSEPLCANAGQPTG